MNPPPQTSRELSPLERFRRLPPNRMELKAILGMLPKAELSGMTLLDIGMPNPVMSQTMRERGGVWCTLARSPSHAQEASAFLKTDVACLGADGTIPYDANSFDVLVVALDILAAVPDPLAFVKECNRCLKRAGMLIISAQARRAMSFADAIRNRNWPDPKDPRAATFTESSLYQTIKNGFDIQKLDSYSHFWVELVRIRAAKLADEGYGNDQISLMLEKKFALAEKLDRFHPFGRRGHVLILSASRRQWTNRIVPVLADGRTICEAVLFNPPD